MPAQGLAELLQGDRLPMPPAVALDIVNATSRPDCEAQEVVELLSRDGVLCGKLLRAANSSLYARKRPVAAIARAVDVLGLKAVRSLVLALSLPALVGRGRLDPWLNQFWVSSVAGAVFARELVARERRPPDDDFVAGLLRDLGTLVFHQHLGPAWSEYLARNAGRLTDDPCGAEREAFGLDHAEASAELLRRWHLPADIVEPIRRHHVPALVAAAEKAQARRAELLWFVDRLAQLDVVAERPHLLEPLLAVARDRFGLPLPDLIAFVQQCAPHVEAFSGLMKLNLGRSPDYAQAVAAGASALIALRTGVGPDPDDHSPGETTELELEPVPVRHGADRARPRRAW